MKILFKNGFIIDGSGEKGFYGDVLVEGERIVEVAPNIDCVADEVGSTPTRITISSWTEKIPRGFSSPSSDRASLRR